jgi:hypothetical protein
MWRTTTGFLPSLHYLDSMCGCVAALSLPMTPGHTWLQRLAIIHLPKEIPLPDPQRSEGWVVLYCHPLFSSWIKGRALGGFVSL